MSKSLIPLLGRRFVYFLLYTASTDLIFVLFGAPLVRNQWSTFGLSVWFAFLSFSPFLAKYEPTPNNVRRILWDPVNTYEFFTMRCFWGTLFGTWASAFFLILDWDRPWQAWPIPCVVGALVGDIFGLIVFCCRQFPKSDWIDDPHRHPHNCPAKLYFEMQCGVPELDTLLSNVLGFLREHSWVYGFKWVDLLSCAGTLAGDPVACCPAEWRTTLCSAEISDLQSVVLGDPPPANWPASLKTFVRQCRTLSQRLTESSSCILTSPNQPTASFGHVITCSSAGYLAYATASSSSDTTKHVKVKLKKQHEIEVMSAFVCDMLQNTLTAATVANYDTRSRTFQTSEFFAFPQSPTRELRSCESSRSGQLRIGGLVDLGSGLGHFPNYVWRMWTESVVNPQIPRPRLVAVEADATIHSRAKELEDKKVLPNDRIRRECLRVTTSNLEDLRERLGAHFSDLSEPYYLLCGLHCCGDLSVAAINLFLSDPNAHGMALVGCCYHKMTPQMFPMSSTLRNALACHCDLSALTSTVALRLACQWSPQQWCRWSPVEVHQHRIRVFVRSVIQVFFNPHSAAPSTQLRKIARVDPLKCLTEDLQSTQLLSVDQPLPNLTAHWQALRKIDDHCNFEALQCFASTQSAIELWHLLPGITALQQLIQPLLEALILSDRVWVLRESGVPYVTLLRLFNPLLSPRCMALVAKR
ncbi:hypothetical protein AAHC03_025486 [Spirometra sp. Aus1]